MPEGRFADPNAVQSDDGGRGRVPLRAVCFLFSLLLGLSVTRDRHGSKLHQEQVTEQSAPESVCVFREGLIREPTRESIFSAVNPTLLAAIKGN